ncbi:response regulator transcription factor [Chryseolinea sp. T2]|uniref:response regulator transcription factor n=1 Tax=Chryseolinea sp. T2 TaxID=3129255 RepID=UPI003077CE28
MNPIRIFLADDHMVIRDGLRALLERNGSYAIVGEASNGSEALERVATTTPDVIFLDLSMPGMNGMDTARRLREEFGNVKVVILSMHNELEYIVQCLEHDVMGYVVKNDGGKEVIKALEAVVAGRKYYSDAVAQAIMGKYRQQRAEVLNRKQVVVEITNREKQVMEHLAQGHTNSRIADDLFISIRTVETHRANLMRKLEAKNCVELVNKARELNFIR